MLNLPIMINENTIKAWQQIIATEKPRQKGASLSESLNTGMAMNKIPNDAADIQYMSADEVYRAGGTPIQVVEGKAGSAGMFLPEAIRNEMLNNPIDTSSLNPDKEQLQLNKLLENMAAKRAAEQKNVSSAPSQSNQNTFIDYDKLKKIINECIDEKLSDATALKGISLKNKTIKLVDNSGNVFEAKLEYKGKLKATKS